MGPIYLSKSSPLSPSPLDLSSPISRRRCRGAPPRRHRVLPVLLSAVAELHPEGRRCRNPYYGAPPQSSPRWSPACYCWNPHRTLFFLLLPPSPLSQATELGSSWRQSCEWARQRQSLQRRSKATDDGGARPRTPVTLILISASICTVLDFCVHPSMCSPLILPSIHPHRWRGWQSPPPRPRSEKIGRWRGGDELGEDRGVSTGVGAVAPPSRRKRRSMHAGCCRRARAPPRPWPSDAMLHRDDSSSRMWLRRGLHLLPGDSKLVIREGGGGNYLDLSLLQGPPRHIPPRQLPRLLKLQTCNVNMGF